ncbi:hypothetical protein [Streptomyces sp. NPDC090994]|uniref:hypothetical protein n=1 Tax=Streptomyces sp. NPDC090994 TaxID=3365969 RepID=UPI00381F89C9
MVEVGTTDPKAGGGLLRPERGIGGDQVRQVLASADLRDLTGVVVLSEFAFRSTSRPRSTNRRSTNAVTFVFSPARRTVLLAAARKLSHSRES